jgi:hypothetical protein
VNDFTVSKRGEIRHLGVRTSPQDLPHLLYIQWASFSDLQKSWVGLSIWMMNETVHVWAPSGHEFQARWTDDENIRKFCSEHGEPFEFD